MGDINHRKLHHTNTSESAVDPLRAKLNPLGFGASTVENDEAVGFEGFDATVEDSGVLVAEVFGGNPHGAACAAQRLGHDLGGSEGDSEIIRFCTTFGIECVFLPSLRLIIAIVGIAADQLTIWNITRRDEPASKFNSSSAFCCSVFWDRSANCIILAFKVRVIFSVVLT